MARADLERLAADIAGRRGVPPALFQGLVAHESNGWKVRAIRQEPRINDASRGLTQILLRTARGLGYQGTPEGLFDPATNLDLGARYLAQQIRQFGVEGGLAAYNGGPGAGHRVTRPLTTVLARDQVTGVAIRTYTAQPGQFRNQPYVDAVLRAAQPYGHRGTGTLAGAGGLLASLALVGAFWRRWRGR